MERSIYLKLHEWKNSLSRKPLILKGARQVGKTYLLKEFGKKEYEDLAYFNFEEEPRLKEFFQSGLKPHSILEKLSLFLGKKIQAGKSLIFFDEIQAAPNALNALKYFHEDAPEYHLVAAGSLLGVGLNNIKSFPVGKVNFLEMYPLTFFEFLDALGKTALRQFLESIKKPEPLDEIFHLECCELLKKYYFIGGMPEAVASFVAEGDWEKVRKIQKDILTSYLMDFSKHASKNETIKMMAIWESMPKQLAKESKKFKFSLANKNARARDYHEAVQWISRAGLLILAKQVKTPKIPLSGYEHDENFKAYLFDIGILSAMVGLGHSTLIDGDRLFMEFKGALVENFVAQELVAAGTMPLHYWSLDQVAEIEFLIETEKGIFPL
ncbi:MAG: AAA family ATPase, partial [Pseudomonadota bacterium]